MQSNINASTVLANISWISNVNLIALALTVVGSMTPPAYISIVIIGKLPPRTTQGLRSDESGGKKTRGNQVKP